MNWNRGLKSRRQGLEILNIKTCLFCHLNAYGPSLWPKLINLVLGLPRVSLFSDSFSAFIVVYVFQPFFSTIFRFTSSIRTLVVFLTFIEIFACKIIFKYSIMKCKCLNITKTNLNFIPILCSFLFHSPFKYVKYISTIVQNPCYLC